MHSILHRILTKWFKFKWISHLKNYHFVDKWYAERNTLRATIRQLTDSLNRIEKSTRCNAHKFLVFKVKKKMKWIHFGLKFMIKKHPMLYVTNRWSAEEENKKQTNRLHRMKMHSKNYSMHLHCGRLSHIFFSSLLFHSHAAFALQNMWLCVCAMFSNVRFIEKSTSK